MQAVWIYGHGMWIALDSCASRDKTAESVWQQLCVDGLITVAGLQKRRSARNAPELPEGGTWQAAVLQRCVVKSEDCHPDGSKPSTASKNAEPTDSRPLHR